ncbi:hypothetical protein GCM10023068_05820 [Leifsonia shinshuensis]
MGNGGDAGRHAERKRATEEYRAVWGGMSSVSDVPAVWDRGWAVGVERAVGVASGAA